MLIVSIGVLIQVWQHGPLLAQLTPVTVLLFGLPICLLLLHAFQTQGWQKTLIFILLATSIGTFFEHLGLQYGVFFGGHYVYAPLPTWFGVPIVVSIFWAVFIYTGYSVTAALCSWFKQPNSIWWAILDSFWVVSIDLILDPMAVKFHNWTWLPPIMKQYFGIPWGNFLGWVIVSFLVCAIFRWLTSIFPRQPRQELGWYLVPVFAYLVLICFLVGTAWAAHLTGPAILGAILICLEMVCNLLFFSTRSTMASCVPSA